VNPAAEPWSGRAKLAELTSADDGHGRAAHGTARLSFQLSKSQASQERGTPFVLGDSRELTADDFLTTALPKKGPVGGVSDADLAP
jgi:hypothetical protein